MKQRLYSLDFLKVIAAVFITNSHFIPLYENVNKSLATLGVHGNALFFFVSGFLLMMGFDKRSKELCFIDWYRSRVRRLWPSVFIWVILSSVICSKILTVSNLVLMSDYWFLQAIVINYIPFYILMNVLYRKVNRGGYYGKIVFSLSFLASVICFFCMPKVSGSPFHSSFHYVCHFSIMILGAMAYKAKKDTGSSHIYRDTCWLILSFVSYFLILKIGKGRTDYLYYTQITALIPLHLFVYYAYKVASHDWTTRVFQNRFIGRILSTIANLTLEIYIVQFLIITNKFNWLFPFNTLIVFFLICVAAYVLRVFTSFFLYIVSKESFDYKSIIKV